MNFPLDEPIFRFLYWLVNTPGLGAIAVFLVGGGSITAYALTLFWISRGADAPEREVYTFPTPALHSHEHDG